MTLIAKTYWAGAPWSFRRPPARAAVSTHTLRTFDARQIHALYWTPEGTPSPRVAVVCLHPRVDFTHHYVIPRLVAAGIGCLGATSRNPNNDLDTEHEPLVLDLLACTDFLRREKNVKTIILLGNSGGGSLAALYQNQARLPAAQRIARTPAGARTFLPEADLVPADALILVSAHRGQGKVLAECIDPSVIDERDPLLTDPSLDMYSPANGFKEPPAWSEYSPAFVTRFRAAQHERVRRLDTLARALIAEGRDAHKTMRAPGFASLPFETRQRVERRADFEPVMTVYRTMASLHYTDRRLDPSGRDYGSLLSDRPDRMNFSLLGFARVCTPRAWLSTWSGQSSNADLVKNLAGIAEPVLVVHAGRDREIYPQTDAKPIFSAVRSADRTFVEIESAGHYFEPPLGSLDAPDVEALMDHVIGWITARHDVARPATPSAPVTPRPAEPARHPTTATWRFPPPGRAPLPHPLQRANLRELAARPARHEHHLTIVATIGPAQLEFATASEPVPFAHQNLSDEYVLTMATGDPLVDGFPGRTFLFDPDTFDLAARVQHRAGDITLNPYGLLHWPGQLRPPYAPPAFPPGMRRTMLMLVCCAGRVSPPGETRPTFLSAGREDACKALGAQPVPLHLADTAREESRLVGAVAGSTLALLVAPDRIAPPRGGYLVILGASPESAYFPGDLIHIPPGAEAPVTGIERALLFTSDTTPADPPPPSWSEVPGAPFAPFEDGPREPLPLAIGDLALTALSGAEVRAEIHGKGAAVPRHWLARTMFRAALHGFRLGYLETYGGFFYDDRGGRYRLGVRGAGEIVLDEGEARAAVERIYRAVAPEGYTERLVP